MSHGHCPYKQPPAKPDNAAKIREETKGLHTGSISIHTHDLTVVPFVIVGLMASIRRRLVITMQAAALGDQGGMPGQATTFRNSMIELGLMSFLILAFVFSIIRLRRASRGIDAESE